MYMKSKLNSMGNSDGDVGGVVDWSEIAEDELVSIVNCLHSVTDYFHLSQVCKPWRSINTLTPQNVLIPQPPLLMLAESKKNTTKEEDNLQTNNKTVRRGFVGLNNTNKVYELHLPELYQRRCVGSTDDYMMGYIGTGTEGGSDMGVFDLKDGTIKPHYAGISTSLYSPPLWIIPQSLYQS